MKIASLDSSTMSPEKFDDDDWIEQVYLPELHRCLCKALGASDVTIFDWMLRKRAVSFPKRNVGEENEDAAQPSLSVHIGEYKLKGVFVTVLMGLDYTTAELEGRLEQYFGKDKKRIKKRRYQVIK